MIKDHILAEIKTNKDKYIQLLRKLIQTDSYNPPGNEKNLAIVIKDFFKAHEIECDIFPLDEDNRANLLGYLNKNFEGKNIIYNAHLDVVPPGFEEEWKYPPLEGKIKRNKYMYGRGAADMKGGLAAMMISLSILKSLNLNLRGNLIFMGVSDEETGGALGTKRLLDTKLREIHSDFIVIGEPSGIDPLPKAIILGERGHLQLKVIANGVSCHASMPQMGINPIYIINEIITNLDKIDDHIPNVEPPLSIDQLKELMSDAFPSKEIFERILADQELLQNVIKSLTTFTKTSTMIKGGIKENVVPDICELVIDFRLLPNQDPNDIINALKKLVNKLGYEIREEAKGKPEEVFVSFEIIHQSEGSYWKNWKKSKDLKKFYEITKTVYDKTPLYFLFPACADAHYLRKDYCESTILFGPGNARTAHATDENIEIKDFINSIKVYTLFAYELLK
ncbi:MAG: M20 family metallopeptidase [Candidatus Lokiarchaeota archaeon]